MCGIATLGGVSCGPAPAPVTIRAGLLLDGRGGQLRDVVVTVVAGKIVSVAPWRSGAVTHDLSAYTVLPGLIDAHVHISGYFNRLGQMNTGGDGDTPEQREAGRAANALATLRAGFTTVVSMGSENDKAIRERIDRGAIPGPRILTSLAPVSDTTLTPREFRRWLRRQKAAGADFVKIFAANDIRFGGAPTFSVERLAALCARARRVGLRSVVHAQSDASIRLAVEAGCDQVEHGFLATSEGLRALAARGVYFDPQCALLFTNYLEHRDRFEELRGFDSTAFSLMARLRTALPELFRTARDVRGLKLLYGTDATAGAHGRNGEDLICRVREGGQPPMDALVTATSRNALALGLGRRIGTIAPGYLADIIALEGNPLDSIEAVRRVRFVMKGGVVVVKPQ